jgi:16S rRNA (guanine527-N7)-methyltransferase
MTSQRPPARPLTTVEDLAELHGLPGAPAARLRQLAAVLAEDATAPTTIRDPGRVLRDHLADSLVALELEEVARARSIADLGSGAGLPGLCLAIALPLARIRLIESNAKKCRFLVRAVEALALDNVEVVSRRVEEWVEGAQSSDLVTARALAAPEVVLEYAAPLLTVGGRLVAWRGQDGAQITAGARRAAARLGLEIERSIPVRPYRGSEHRHLLVALKRDVTPPDYPRRPGMAVKRPLGGG